MQLDRSPTQRRRRRGRWVRRRRRGPRRRHRRHEHRRGRRRCRRLELPRERSVHVRRRMLRGRLLRRPRRRLPGCRLLLHDPGQTLLGRGLLRGRLRRERRLLPAARNGLHHARRVLRRRAVHERNVRDRRRHAVQGAGIDVQRAGRMLRPRMHERRLPALLGWPLLRGLPSQQVLLHQRERLRHRRRLLRRLVRQLQVLLAVGAQLRGKRGLLQLEL